ncbi:hypothetical protein [Pseudofrankia sp. BMG5.37]|nr:hypothetical protein [Pseudofrankia sp. BMG5.37]MDT3446039.1 hypothetical protein [Pseudofrankia sp. BMG5.37]
MAAETDELVVAVEELAVVRDRGEAVAHSDGAVGDSGENRDG